MHRSRFHAALAACLLVLGACGGGDDDTTDGAADQADQPAAQEPGAEPADEPAEEPAAASGSGGQGSATLTLDNGERFEFSILCALEPQEAAGSQILFAVVSYDDPGLDITQFGDEGVVGFNASISIYDGDFETLWEAASLYEAFGGTIELTQDGSTIRGEGSFYAGGDPANTPVEGEVVANC